MLFSSLLQAQCSFNAIFLRWGSVWLAFQITQLVCFVRLSIWRPVINCDIYFFSALIYKSSHNAIFLKLHIYSFTEYKIIFIKDFKIITIIWKCQVIIWNVYILQGFCRFLKILVKNSWKFKKHVWLFFSILNCSIIQILKS